MFILRLRENLFGFRMYGTFLCSTSTVRFSQAHSVSFKPLFIAATNSASTHSTTTATHVLPSCV